MNMIFDGSFWETVTRMTLLQMIFVLALITLVGILIVAARLARRSSEITGQYFDYHYKIRQLERNENDEAPIDHR